jgi:hypothetical protein
MLIFREFQIFKLDILGWGFGDSWVVHLAIQNSSLVLLCDFQMMTHVLSLAHNDE